MITKRLLRWLDDRTGAAPFARAAARKIFPDHWSFMLGEIALYALIILVVTGIFLAMFFNGSDAKTVYEGSYAPLQGVQISKAYASVLDISFDVPAGLLARQMHHWAALIFIGAIALHLTRNFFTGAYRRPREINWIIGLTLLLLAMFNGFSGYSIPDDLLSGVGLRIAYSTALSIPIAGEWMAFLMFGGRVPAGITVSRLYSLHIIVAFVILGLLALHMTLLVRQKHTNYPGPNRTDKTIVGSRFWPQYAIKTTGLLLIVTGGVALLGALVQINPVWLYGPYQAGAVSSVSQPDWYILFGEGALRLWPSSDIHIGSYLVPGIFFPGIVMPGILFTTLYLWPFVEAWITGDRAPGPVLPRIIEISNDNHGKITGRQSAHHVLQLPSEHPVRTAIGCAAITFIIVLMFAGSQDMLSMVTGGSLADIRNILRILVMAVPVLVGAVAYLACRLIMRNRRRIT